MRRYWIIILILCAGCASSPPQPDNIRMVTAVPTVLSAPTITPQEISFTAPSNCNSEQNSDELADYLPSGVSWLEINGTRLVLDGTTFHVSGVNYYPRMSPFDLFLTDSEPDVISKELDVIGESGINTLRISVSLKQLFLCEGRAIPNVDAFALLDNIIKTIASHNLRLIIVLHTQIDDIDQTNWQNLQFVVSRYVNESAILAWDVLDKGDGTYDAFSQQAVLTWLANAILAIRQVDSHHSITAGWETHAIDTISLVDIVSFQHFGDYLPLRQEIANLRATSDKPIILSAIGFSTFDMDETAQRNLLFQAMEEVTSNQLAGWLIYMAFDYPTSVTCIEPDCPTQATSINYYGIWNTSYFPKLAVDAVKRVTNTE